MTGEDFGYLLNKVPGVMFWLGVDTPYPLHNQKSNRKDDNPNMLEIKCSSMTKNAWKRIEPLRLSKSGLVLDKVRN
ncbi:hypothetical protein XK29_01235 [Streptococcus suis]|nr:hypothetical protein XK29_01235 [Streptococcus suis]